MCICKYCLDCVAAEKKKKLIVFHKYASHTYTHTGVHALFIFDQCAGPQRIEEMQMCPAAFLFGSTADDPALGPVGRYLQQNDYCISAMQIEPSKNKQEKYLIYILARREHDPQLALKHKRRDKKGFTDI